MKFPNFQRPWPKFSHFQAWTKVPHHCLFFVVVFWRPYEPCVQATQYSGTLPETTPPLKPPRSEVLRSLRHYLQAQSQGHHTPLIVWRRNAWKKEALSDLPWKDERRSSSIRQTLEKTKAILGKLLRDRVECIGLFQAHQYHLELNWSKTTFPPALSILILWKWYEPHTKDWPPLSTDFHCGLSSGFPLCCCNNFYIKVLQRYWFSQTSNLCLLKHFDISVVLQTFFK